MDARYKIDDENREFIEGPGVLPTKSTITELKGKGGSVAVEVIPESEGGARRASSRPRGFVKGR